MNRIFIVLTAFSFTLCGSLFAECSHKAAVASVKGSFFPDTWTCPHCGYENFEGISACAVCGR